MKIIDVDIHELERVGRRGRARSEATQQLLDVIDSLKPKQAKAIMLASGDTSSKISARLNYAARLVGKRLQIASQEDRILFALSNRPARRRRSARK